MSDPDEVIWKTFCHVFKGCEDEGIVKSVLSTIRKAGRTDGLREAASIAASHDVEDAEVDTVVRDIAREIIDVID